MDIQNLIKESIHSWPRTHKLIEIGHIASPEIETYLEDMLPGGNYNTLLYALGRIGNIKSFDFLLLKLKIFYKHKELCLSILDSMGNLPLYTLKVKPKIKLNKLLAIIAEHYKGDHEVLSSIVFVIDNLYIEHTLRAKKSYFKYTFEEIIQLIDVELKNPKKPVDMVKFTATTEFLEKLVFSKEYSQYSGHDTFKEFYMITSNTENLKVVEEFYRSYMSSPELLKKYEFLNLLYVFEEIGDLNSLKLLIELGNLLIDDQGSVETLLAVIAQIIFRLEDEVSKEGLTDLSKYVVKVLKKYKGNIKVIIYAGVAYLTPDCLLKEREKPYWDYTEEELLSIWEPLASPSK